LAGFEGFKDFEVEGADVKGFEAVGVSFEDVVLEDRARCERDGGSSKRPSGSAIVYSMWSSIRRGQLLNICSQAEIIIFSYYFSDTKYKSIRF
jgi:hypothetical protein